VIVADTNLIAYAFVAGPFSADAEKVLSKDADWLSPPQWQNEFLHFLWTSVRRKVISDSGAYGAYSEAEERVRTSRRPRARSVLSLAFSSGCSPYDCEFVVLARSAGVPLVTNDQQVLAAFPGVAVSIEEFAR
jgi:predicted nucleic acid-binding protein